jgi:hypothetical protein
MQGIVIKDYADYTVFFDNPGLNDIIQKHEVMLYGL